VQPLRVTDIADGMVASIERVLQGKSEQENQLRTLFVSALHSVSTTVNELLNDYRDKRSIGMYNFALPVGC